MKTTGILTLGLAALLTMPALALAENAAGAAKTRETEGIVKYMDPTRLVISRLPQYGQRNMTFVIDPSTQREGSLAVGSTVDVRYRTDNKRRIATNVTVEQPKEAPSMPASHQ
jgi:hypothetical protein